MTQVYLKVTQVFPCVVNHKNFTFYNKLRITKSLFLSVLSPIPAKFKFKFKFILLYPKWLHLTWGFRALGKFLFPVHLLPLPFTPSLWMLSLKLNENLRNTHLMTKVLATTLPAIVLLNQCLTLSQSFSLVL